MTRTTSEDLFAMLFELEGPQQKNQTKARVKLSIYFPKCLVSRDFPGDLHLAAAGAGGFRNPLSQPVMWNPFTEEPSPKWFCLFLQPSFWGLLHLGAVP